MTLLVGWMSKYMVAFTKFRVMKNCILHPIHILQSQLINKNKPVLYKDKETAENKKNIT